LQFRRGVNLQDANQKFALQEKKKAMIARINCKTLIARSTAILQLMT
jgi:hypothetical protein